MVSPQKKRVKRSNSGGNPCLVCAFLQCCAIVILVFCAVVGYNNLDHELQVQKDDFEHELTKQRNDCKTTYQDKVDALTDERDELQQDREVMLEDARREEALQKDAAVWEEQRQEKETNKMDYLQTYRTKMHQEIQRISRRVVLEKFGPGPFQVQLLFQIDPTEPGYENTNATSYPNRIVFELAPLEDMPHSIYLFLSQVSLGLWNNCSIHRNAGHVLQTGTAPSFMNLPNAHLQRPFRAHDVESVSFQEYSPKFPHLPLTIGYAGRPGGPDFYISLEDNSENHGPGGQTAYDAAEEADPCFGKVVEGQDAVWRLHALETEQDDYEALIRPVAILEMKILGLEKEEEKEAPVVVEKSSPDAINNETKKDSIVEPETTKKEPEFVEEAKKLLAHFEGKDEPASNNVVAGETKGIQEDKKAVEAAAGDISAAGDTGVGDTSAGDAVAAGDTAVGDTSAGDTGDTATTGDAAAEDEVKEAESETKGLAVENVEEDVVDTSLEAHHDEGADERNQQAENHLDEVTTQKQEAKEASAGIPGASTTDQEASGDTELRLQHEEE